MLDTRYWILDAQQHVARCYTALQSIRPPWWLKQNTMNRKMIFTLALAAMGFVLGSCSLRSTTYIKANEQFQLGNNNHGRFRVKLRNTSAQDIEIYRAPITGGRHSGQSVKPGETVGVRVEANTALVIVNPSAQEASVQLTVHGDTGLAMNYRNN